MTSLLFDNDWQYALNVIYRLNALNDLAGFQQKTLEYISLSTPAHQSLFSVLKRENGKVSFMDTPVVFGAEALYLKEFNRKYARDPFFAKADATLKGSVSRDTDLLPDDQRVETEWYKKIYEKQGIHYALRSRLTYNDTLIGSIDLFRQKTEPDFSDKEVKLLEILTPHISLKLAYLVGLVGDSGQHVRTYAPLARKLMTSYGLTARESEVIEMVVNGVATEQVATNLCISKSTLKKHIHNAYRKMEVRNRRELYTAVGALENQ